MKKKMLYELHWQTYHYDINHKKIEPYDIFRHWRFNEDVISLLNKRGMTEENFREKLKSDLMYYFWSKCEYEVLVAGWPPTDNKDEEEKIDIYDQVMLNFDQFASYVWNSVTHRTRKKLANSEEEISEEAFN